MLYSIFSADAGITLAQAGICLAASLVLGLVVSACYMYKNSYNKNFVITLALMPVMVQSVIMLVNGNLGTGVAVMGAFSLVRFRSAPGSSKDIISIFFSMAIGLATGMGYVVFAAIFTLIIAALMVFYLTIPLGEGNPTIKTLKITLPETTDYSQLFDDLFGEYTKTAALERVRTINMGSLYELQYTINLKNPAEEKNLLDQIRCRNGNLPISCGRFVASKDEL